MRVQSLGWEDLLAESVATTPVFLPGESRGQRSLAGYSPLGCKELDVPEATPQLRSLHPQPVGPGECGGGCPVSAHSLGSLLSLGKVRSL